ncbi:MAG TPA: type II toxin-antitoxin system prevent-host-death family antitoxin [Methylomusa anaerophila]|uniref:Antitoxin n=1 Tax=Methylomusa anaerophila TaxID=1930071 RepID=A0A348AKW9_9FIRM|nr:type II toxin-antitoxin system prevent-host-death family antitoxin [Methylomusa anaerophila]BBB91717.1 Phd_YefM [Methylomusa anaerophila]HML88547.1 type II toxin-antitoxin system prevent-host-death family antitoxin [Methylomusa anaerophila]
MTVSASVAKQKFGQIIDAARVKPVIIEKSGKEVVVVLSVERFRELQALEDAYWIAQAEEGLKSGLMGPEKTAQFLKERLDAE